MGEERRKLSKQESIDKRFALVDTAGELRYPYKKYHRATGKYGFAVGRDRYGAGIYLDNLEDVIRSVVFDGRLLRVTVDPPTKGKGSNGLSLHAGREVRGYVIADEFKHLVAGAPLAPLGSPANYPRPTSIPDSRLLAVWGIASGKDLKRLSSAERGELHLMRSANWSTMSAELKRKRLGMEQMPLLLAEEGAGNGAVWIADIESIETGPGPSAVVELRNLGRLLKPVPPALLSNFHTGESLAAPIETDVPCVMSVEVAASLSQRLPAQAFEDEPLLPEARQAELEVAADPQCADAPDTVRRALANARIGQGGYRKRMLKLWGSTCAVTGCSIQEVLVASHAKSWAESTNAQRLDEYNGLLLAASIDRLFDGGLIGFDDEGHMLVSETLTDADLISVGLSRTSGLRTVEARHRVYLQAHRHNHAANALTPQSRIA